MSFNPIHEEVFPLEEGGARFLIVFKGPHNTLGMKSIARQS